MKEKEEKRGKKKIYEAKKQHVHMHYTYWKTSLIKCYVIFIYSDS